MDISALVAVYNSGTYKSPLPAVLLSTADYLRGYRPAGPDMVVADAASGVSTATSRAVVTNAIASDPLLEVDRAADYKAQLDHSVDTILEMFAALLGRMPRCEAVLMAALAALLGIGLGSAFGLATVRALSSAENGRIVLSVPYTQLAFYSLISACAGLFAAIMPARRAARTSVVTAMTEH